MSKSLRKITIYTDGACSPNPGIGGWGVLLRDEHTKKTRELSGSKRNTTAPEMELTAALQALEHLKYPCEVTIFTDSKYVQLGITQWIDKWRLGNWKKSIKHKHKWKRLYELDQTHIVHWNWVPGHDGIPGNEKADELAVAARIDLACEMEVT